MKSKFLNAVRSLAIVSGLVLSMGSGLAYASINVAGSNEMTGPDSANISTQNSDLCLDAAVLNSGTLLNDVDPVIETGANDLSDNTSVDCYSTGNVLGNLDFQNCLNSDDFVNFIPFDTFGNISFMAQNRCTGPDSLNTNTVNVDRDITLAVTNTAAITNDIDFTANTGNNVIDDNTCVGGVMTGNVAVSSNIQNIANQNAHALNLGALGCNNVAATFGNCMTGPSSDNENILNANTDITATITNTAVIDNDYDVVANTGNNVVDCNTCVGNVQTGSVAVNITGINQAN